MGRGLFAVIIGLLLALVFGGICPAQTSNSEEITITTYYPSPYGAYKNLLLHPSDQPTSGVEEGLMYYDSDKHILRYRDDEKWVALGGIDCKIKPFNATNTPTECPEKYFTWPGYSVQKQGRMLCCTVSNPPK